MTQQVNFDQIADFVSDGGNNAVPTGRSAPLWAMLDQLTRTTRPEDVYRAAAEVAPGLPDDVLTQALTPIAPHILAGDEAQYTAFRQALLDEVAARTEQTFYDRAAGDLAAADDRVDEPGYLMSIGRAVDQVLRDSTWPASWGVHRAALDYLHTHALTKHLPHQGQPDLAHPDQPGHRRGEPGQGGAGMTINPIPDEVFADAHLAAAAEVYTGTEWHAPINAAVRAAIDRFFGSTTADQRLLGMLKSLPAAMSAAAERDGCMDATDEVRQAFEAGCAFITEAVEEWLTTHTVVALPALASVPPRRPVVEVDDSREVVTGFLDDDGTPFVQAGYVVWNGATGEQIALGILAVLRALRTTHGGER